jgi:hypothetical protein
MRRCSAPHAGISREPAESLLSAGPSGPRGWTVVNGAPFLAIRVAASLSDVNSEGSTNVADLQAPTVVAGAPLSELSGLTAP